MPAEEEVEETAVVKFTDTEPWRGARCHYLASMAFLSSSFTKSRELDSFFFFFNKGRARGPENKFQVTKNLFSSKINQHYHEPES